MYGSPEARSWPSCFWMQKAQAERMRLRSSAGRLAFTVSRRCTKRASRSGRPLRGFCDDSRGKASASTGAADTGTEGGAAGGDASSSLPVSLVGVAPVLRGARESDALEIGVSGRAIAMGYYTGGVCGCREVVAAAVFRSLLGGNSESYCLRTPGVGRLPPCAQRTISSNASPISFWVKLQWPSRSTICWTKFSSAPAAWTS
jgi:hypothetical protein